MSEYNFEVCYNSTFHDGAKNPFGALRMSDYDPKYMMLPDNIYFDIEFNNDNIDLVRNAKYITFSNHTIIDSNFLVDP